MVLDVDLEKEIKAYCKLNNLKFTVFVNDMIRKQFSIEKYGDIPFGKIINPLNKNDNRKDKITETIINDNIITYKPKEKDETVIKIIPKDEQHTEVKKSIKVTLG